MRGVVRAALKRAAQPEGLPGEHHFYVTFKTTAPGVSLPPDLAATYPNEMTVVLQNQYRDLAPGETFFSVMLSFDRQPKRLSIPYAAITRFFDPSVQFMLKFEVPEGRAGAHHRRAQACAGREPRRRRTGSPKVVLARPVPQEIAASRSRPSFLEFPLTS